MALRQTSDEIGTTQLLNDDVNDEHFDFATLLAAAQTNQSCVEAVELMYTAAGSRGIYKKNKLAHYLMDAQVLRQHGFMNESRYETAAQIFFGLPPALPIVEL
ncbi:MAG TPA: hypothetical protein VJ765_10170 [Chitinophagaceae bacterium]|nr:hypothetical protein [Chitinophagaceae bacterium]